MLAARHHDDDDDDIHIILLNNFSFNIIGNNLNKLGIKTTVTLSLKKNRDLLYSSSQHDNIPDAYVYYIPCKDWKLKYIRETSRNIHKRLSEHRINIRVGNLNNALLQHIFKFDHNFDFNADIMLPDIYNERWKRVFEAGALSHCQSNNNQPGFSAFPSIWGNSFLITAIYSIFN